MFEKLPIAERVRTAKEKARRVVDHLSYLIELHENNAIVLYSQTLSAQIPTSYAANAFNVFQQGLHQFEIVRLCALWDRAEPEKENIPTVIELIDHPDVIESLALETASHWQGLGGHILNPSDDPETQALEVEALYSVATINLVLSKRKEREMSYVRRLSRLGQFWFHQNMPRL